MIAVAIIAILAAVGLPAYNDYVTRGKFQEAASALAAMRVKMEQFFQDQRTYVGACQPNTVAPLPTGLKYYTVACSNLTQNTYKVTATGADGFIFSVDEANTRKTEQVPAGSSWSLPATNCWVTKKPNIC
jgi:type IV pilus assembly protein PilE